MGDEYSAWVTSKWVMSKWVTVGVTNTVRDTNGHERYGMSGMTHVDMRGVTGTLDVMSRWHA